jgi:hypothetical protein
MRDNAKKFKGTFDRKSRARSFVEVLLHLPPLPEVFNPWLDLDPDNDMAAEAPRIRTDNLTRYLEQRTDHAQFVLIGEAPSYRGAKFCGIAMTSERILLGGQSKIPPDAVFDGPKARTSRCELFPKGSIEPTASVVWSLLLSMGFAPGEFIFWNAFPCHPHKPQQRLTNRAPTPIELRTTGEVLPALLALAPHARVVAVGRVAQKALAALSVAAPAVRHPAMGGATQFRRDIQALFPR